LWTIEHRARQLEDVIGGSARFAKLPQPQPQPAHRRGLLERLRRQSGRQPLPLALSRWERGSRCPAGSASGAAR
ncbi:MAG: hypothetical protein E6Q74_08525, partial [Pseudoxanthomonas sp.]